MAMHICICANVLIYSPGKKHLKLKLVHFCPLAIEQNVLSHLNHSMVFLLSKYGNMLNTSLMLLSRI